MRYAKLALLIVCTALVAFLAGCPSLDSTQEPRVKISGDINATEERFNMNGTIYTSQGNDYAYESITLSLYHANGSLIESRQLGTLEEVISFSVSSETLPAYVLVDSPTFWQQKNFAVEYIKYRGGKGVPYRHEWAKSRSDFPVNQSNLEHSQQGE